MPEATRIILLHHIAPDWPGGSMYVRNLARAIAALPESERQGVVVDVEDLGLIPDLETDLEGVVRNIWRPSRLARLLVDHISWPLGFRMLSRARGHERSTFVYPFIGGVPPFETPYAWASWIPDFQHRHLPDLFSEAERRQRDDVDAAIAAAAPAVVLSSAMAEQDFRTFYPSSPAITRVLSFATTVDPDLFAVDPAPVVRSHDLPTRYFVVCNQFWLHKDHAVVVDAVAILRARGHAPTVVCTGVTKDHRHPSSFADLRERMRSRGVTDDFRILGFIPRSEQLQLMRGSLAVIQPSRFEGWSTVVEDARALGSQILLSDFPVHIEQDPPLTQYFPCGDAEALADLMERTLAADQGRHPQREAAAREATAGRVQAAGRKFLQIARDVRDLRD